VASEGDLANLQRETIETPVASIVTHLQSPNDVQAEFALGDGIFFDKHPNALSVAAEEVSQRLENLRPFTLTRAIPSFSNLWADQICVYTASENDGTPRKLAFVVEYKAPYKLTLASLRSGLRSGLREMEIKIVIDRASLPTAENPEHFEYHADRLVAPVITQTFLYMIQGGTQYGYITMGEAFVFLHIKHNDPRAVYYHLAEPGFDVIAQKEANQDFVRCATVSQVLAFSLLALESATRDHMWLQKDINALNTWNVDVLRSMPISARTSPPHSEYHPGTYTPVGRFSMGLRSRNTCHPPSTPTFEDDQNSSGSDHESPSNTPTRPSKLMNWSKNRAVHRGASSNSQPGTQNSRQARQRRPFCTQRCLQGLVTGANLDPSCPNVSDNYG